jgi:hypothetical protein
MYPTKNISSKLPRHATKRPPYLAEEKVTKVMVHHSGAENDVYKDVSWQVKGRGWWGSSYYMSIDYDGTRFICRKRTEKGWHCGGGGRNHDTLAICLRGNMDNHPPTPDQLASLHEALVGEDEHFGRELELVWHDMYVATSCPGSMMPRKLIAEQLRDHYAPVVVVVPADELPVAAPPAQVTIDTPPPPDPVAPIREPKNNIPMNPTDEDRPGCASAIFLLIALPFVTGAAFFLLMLAALVGIPIPF